MKLSGLLNLLYHIYMYEDSSEFHRTTFAAGHLKVASCGKVELQMYRLIKIVSILIRIITWEAQFRGHLLFNNQEMGLCRFVLSFSLISRNECQCNYRFNIEIGRAHV